ncbi:hypothetical protein [Salinilacihabitans rarus]|uniref:hypothetical protein n=1 Tax=Salinilacihabitans rarus TaxID=2961596 RepID=UPI0020C8805A|nr:hypothetical protein [Salinilacihabitans rarus]
MSTDSTAREVLEEVEADPDAVLDAFDADSPADLIEAGGDHDPTTDDEIDVDDALADELFADLAEPPAPDPEEDESEASTADPAVDRVVVSDPTVVVDEGGASVDEAVADRDPDRGSRSGDEPTLVGPDPTPVRVPDDAFGASSESTDGFDWLADRERSP